MLFNSYRYFLLLALTVVIFHLLKNNRKRLALIVFCSYFFYANWNVFFVPILLFSTLVDYFIGQKIHQSNNKIIARNWLLLSICTNLSLLVFFKSIPLIGSIFDSLTINFTLSIPIGISFYTFQTISYSIDIYRGKIEPELSLLNFACYISFFPQILAGPIERAANLLPQLQFLKPNPNLTFQGLKLILFGLGKKVLIADKLALIVDPIYASPELFDGIAILFATLLFSFQIYCDFSGYTDIALGSARLFGIKLSTNFNKPYMSKSIREFWQKWHISLSSWFRDYVYLPLGGNQGNWIFITKNILIVFLLSGIWHGVGITFILWGFFHGLLYLIERFFKQKKINVFGRNTLFIFIIISFLWIFFRAESLNDLFIIFSKFGNISLRNLSLNEIAHFIELVGQSQYAIGIILSLLFVFIIIDFFKIDEIIIKKNLNKKPVFLELLIVNTLLILLLLFGDWGGDKFIYFQF